MAYNNGFPMNYQPAQFNYQSQPQPVQQQQNPGMIWVQGEAGAKAFPLAPGAAPSNSPIPLWDSEQQTIYLKSVDTSGIPSMKVLDYTVREQGVLHRNNLTDEPKIDLNAFVTYEEFNDRLDELTKKLDKLTTKPRQPEKREYRRSRERNEDDGE